MYRGHVQLPTKYRYHTRYIQSIYNVCSMASIAQYRNASALHCDAKTISIYRGIEHVLLCMTMYGMYMV